MKRDPFNFDIRFSLRFCHKGNRMAERLLPAHYFEKKAPAARILTGFFTKITCIFQISAPAARKNVFADPLKLIWKNKISMPLTLIKINIVCCHDAKYKLSDPHNSRGRNKSTISLCLSCGASVWEPMLCIVYFVSENDKHNHPVHSEKFQSSKFYPRYWKLWSLHSRAAPLLPPRLDPKPSETGN